MAKSPTLPAAAAGNADALLNVTVSKVATAANVIFKPGKTYQVKAKVAAEIGAALATAEAV